MRKLITLSLLVLFFFTTQIAFAKECAIFCRQKITKEVVLPFKLKKGSSEHIIKILNNAKPGTDIYMYLRSGDGKLLEGNKIIKAMKKSKGRTIIEIVSHAYSMGAIIALNADLILTKSNTLLMFHLPRTKNGICTLENKKEFFKNCANKFIDNYGQLIHPLLTSEQWKRFSKGGDIFITGDTLTSRLPKAKLLPFKIRRR